MRVKLQTYMKKFLILLLIVLAIILMAVLIPGNKEEGLSPVAETTQAYQNAIYGYSLSYPSTLDYIEYLPENVVFGKTDSEGNIEGVAEVRVMNISGEPGESFEDAVARELMNLCAADSPSITFSCTGIEQSQPFTTDSGITGTVLYLRGELRNLSTNEVEIVGKGPYFVFATRSSATGSQAIVVHPPLNLSAAEADSTAIRSIADSLTISAVPSQDTRVSKYISENISELSPVKEVLGGTFYVTNIILDRGSGTVEYEDGHIALIADFTYTVSATGEVIIESFTVRE